MGEVVVVVEWEAWCSKGLVVVVDNMAVDGSFDLDAAVEVDEPEMGREASENLEVGQKQSSLEMVYNDRCVVFLAYRMMVFYSRYQRDPETSTSSFSFVDDRLWCDRE